MDPVLPLPELVDALGSGRIDERTDHHLLHDRLEGLDDSATFLSAITAVHELAAADGRFPNLTAWLANPTGPSAAEQFELGLAFLLDGIAARLGMAGSS